MLFPALWCKQLPPDCARSVVNPSQQERCRCLCFSVNVCLGKLGASTAGREMDC